MSSKSARIAFALSAVFVTACSKQQPCPSSQAASSPAPLPPGAPPQAISLADAKRVFAAHDCCGRYINTDIHRVGALRARGRIFTVFQLTFINPESEHGMEHVAILDGLRLLGTYQTHRTHVWFEGSKIRFECAFDERQTNPKLCDEAGFQDVDMSKPQLPKARLIYGQLSQLGNSI